jgi:hypothetical protein
VLLPAQRHPGEFDVALDLRDHRGEGHRLLGQEDERRLVEAGGRGGVGFPVAEGALERGNGFLLKRRIVVGAGGIEGDPGVDLCVSGGRTSVSRGQRRRLSVVTM